MLPPGRASVAAKPAVTASKLTGMTIGIVVVARLAASIAGVATATMTSTLSRTISAASSGRSADLRAIRGSITRF